jgi:hypothetical protein
LALFTFEFLAFVPSLPKGAKEPKEKSKQASKQQARTNFFFVFVEAFPLTARTQQTESEALVVIGLVGPQHRRHHGLVLSPGVLCCSLLFIVFHPSLHGNSFSPPHVVRCSFVWLAPFAQIR